MTHLSKMYVVKDSNHQSEVFSIQESSVNFNFMTLLESQSYSLVTFAEKTNMFSHKLTFKLTGKLFQQGDVSIRLVQMSDPLILLAQIEYGPIGGFDVSSLKGAATDQLAVEIATSAFGVTVDQYKEKCLKISEEMAMKLQCESNYVEGVKARIFQIIFALITDVK